MAFAQNWNHLQQVADHRMALKTLRTGAIGSIIFGSISLLFALIGPIDPIYATVGAVLLGTGLWNLTRPKPAGIVIDGVTLLIVGVYNLTSGVGSGAGLWVKLGIFQLYWGVMAIRRYAQFRGAFSFTPQDTEIRQLDEMVRTIEKGKVKESADLIEFVTTGFYAKPWRGQLNDDVAVLVIRGSHETHFVTKHEFDVQAGDKVMLGKSLKATFTIKGKSYKGSLSPESLERYQSWKLGTRMQVAIAA